MHGVILIFTQHGKKGLRTVSPSDWLDLLLVTWSCPITIGIKHLTNAASLHWILLPGKRHHLEEHIQVCSWLFIECWKVNFNYQNSSLTKNGKNIAMGFANFYTVYSLGMEWQNNIPTRVHPFFLSSFITKLLLTLVFFNITRYSHECECELKDYKLVFIWALNEICSTWE